MTTPLLSTKLANLKNNSRRINLWLNLLIFGYLAFTISQLVGCSSQRAYTPDGPPPFYVDMSKVHNAVPRCEKKSRYGNNSTYTVKGKQYHVMPNSKHYREVGVASWYGMKFHKRLTSCGERFSTLSMTAAHKSLPLPTYVQVKNLENGKKIIVRVNDRGPFYDNRIIDLSYVAAVKLGVFPKGTARVEVVAIDPNTYGKKKHHKPKNLAANAQPQYFIQVGAYKNKAGAHKAAQKILALTQVQPHVWSINTNKGMLYRVELGPIKLEDQKQELLHKLKMAGIENIRTHLEV